MVKFLTNVGQFSEWSYTMLFYIFSQVRNVHWWGWKQEEIWAAKVSLLKKNPYWKSNKTAWLAGAHHINAKFNLEDETKKANRNVIQSNLAKEKSQGKLSWLKRNFMGNSAFEDNIYHLLNRGISRERLQGEILLNSQ